MSDIKAAVERLRQLEDEAIPLDTIYPPLSGLGWDKDRQTVCSDYLAQYPADDDEPITEEWLRLSGRSVGKLWSSLALPCGGRINIFPDATATVKANQSVDLKTRGDVRRLCTALGRELRETP